MHVTVLVSSAILKILVCTWCSVYMLTNRFFTSIKSFDWKFRKWVKIHYTRFKFMYRVLNQYHKYINLFNGAGRMYTNFILWKIQDVTLELSTLVKHLKETCISSFTMKPKKLLLNRDGKVCASCIGKSSFKNTWNINLKLCRQLWSMLMN